MCGMFTYICHKNEANAGKCCFFHIIYHTWILWEKKTGGAVPACAFSTCTLVKGVFPVVSFPSRPCGDGYRQLLGGDPGVTKLHLFGGSAGVSFLRVFKW